MSKDTETYKLQPCVKCGSYNLEADSTGCLEIRGICYQSGWVLCRDCGNEVCVEFDDSGSNLIEWQDMIDIWNAGVVYEGDISCDK